MPHANVWIRKENEDYWNQIEDKSDWINKKLKGTPGLPAATTKRLESLGVKFCKHGAAPELCRFATIKNGKRLCR